MPSPCVALCISWLEASKGWDCKTRNEAKQEAIRPVVLFGAFKEILNPPFESTPERGLPTMTLLFGVGTGLGSAVRVKDVP